MNYSSVWKFILISTFTLLGVCYSSIRPKNFTNSNTELVVNYLMTSRYKALRDRPLDPPKQPLHNWAANIQVLIKLETILVFIFSECLFTNKWILNKLRESLHSYFADCQLTNKQMNSKQVWKFFYVDAHLFTKKTTSQWNPMKIYPLNS